MAKKKGLQVQVCEERGIERELAYNRYIAEKMIPMMNYGV
jgi:hypothetical protein